MQFSPTSCHFISLWSKYSQHPVLQHHQSMLWFSIVSIFSNGCLYRNLSNEFNSDSY
jgi:hypothetical protein